jgi:hypothetical protein
VAGERELSVKLMKLPEEKTPQFFALPDLDGSELQ